MNISIKKTLLLLILFFCNDTLSSVPALSFFIVGNNKIEIKEKDKTKKYEFFISINGYNVNCSGTKMIIWGLPMHFINDSPGDNGYVLFNLTKRTVIKNDLLNHGIFDALFFQDNKRAFISSYWGYTIDLSSGKTDRISDNELNDVDTISEKCIKPINWSFNRFSESN